MIVRLVLIVGGVWVSAIASLLLLLYRLGRQR